MIWQDYEEHRKEIFGKLVSILVECAKPAAAGDQAAGGSGSLLGRFDLKKLLPSKAKSGASA